VAGLVVALVRDLLFSSRVGETARRLGYPFRAARSLEDFRAALAERPALVMIDLASDGFDFEAALAAVEAAGRPGRLLGWTTHALWKASKGLHGRFDQVVTREQLTAELPELLRRHVEDTPRAG
jgi:hypothetical protein